MDRLWVIVVQRERGSRCFLFAVSFAIMFLLINTHLEMSFQCSGKKGRTRANDSAVNLVLFLPTDYNHVRIQFRCPEGLHGR